ncbi:hypothetical protein P3H15_22790 [Rhodococcus sp. T2V]|uniref:hypothetical protein n=1 Tax=Rhodococcus sp. T2V TaxID=3034164 RepID=UPI0023E338BD|nr:hypothetical protein [Rhodococcus sp. T2V]MDF3307854.1 hypothetical protein [Rhodococcus sp. T2V]
MTITPEVFINARLDDELVAARSDAFGRHSQFGSYRHIANNDEGGADRGRVLHLIAKHWEDHADFGRIDWSDKAKSR